MDCKIPSVILGSALEQKRVDRASINGCHWVYVIHWQERGPAKVGVAINPEDRRNELQIGNPFELRVFTAFGFLNREHAFDIESVVLYWLRRRKLMGEWIDATPGQVRDTALRAIAKRGLRHRPWDTLRARKTTQEITRARDAMAEYRRLRD